MPVLLIPDEQSHDPETNTTQQERGLMEFERKSPIVQKTCLPKLSTSYHSTRPQHVHVRGESQVLYLNPLQRESIMPPCVQPMYVVYVPIHGCGVRLVNAPDISQISILRVLKMFSA